MALLFFFLLLLPFKGEARAGEGSARFPDELAVALSYFVPVDSARHSLFARVEDRIEGAAREAAPLAGADAGEVAAVLRREILANLDDKIGLQGSGLGRFSLSQDEILRTVVGYEIFKLRSYLTSGVFPKRYFGFVDEKWDTGKEEGRFLALVHEVVLAINAYQRERGASVRLSDLELVVTYLAEGGALLFRDEPRALADTEPGRIRLGRDLGCDNIGLALDRYESLAGSLDRRFGTTLASAERREGRGGTGDRSVGIDRAVGFRESVVGSGLMFLYEKETAARKLRGVSRSRPSDVWPTEDLMALPLLEQFIVTSLVFNTGTLFSRDWTESIRDFLTIQRLHALSEGNAEKRGRAWRPALPVDGSPGEAFRRLRERGYPVQPTSWQGAYHVLQRYGAFVALREFTDRFNARGDWRGEVGS